MSETVNGVTRRQACSGCCPLESLLDSPCGHVTAGIAGQKQRIAQTNRFAYSLLPKNVFVVMLFERAVESNQSLLAALAVSYQECTEAFLQEDVAQIQCGNLCNP
jgi:hypothetical protein